MSRAYRKIEENESEAAKKLYQHTSNKSDRKREYILFGDQQYCLSSFFLTHVDKLDGFQVRDDDVWVVTHPKCGTTWTQEMVWLIGNNLDYEGAKQHLNRRFPYMDFCSVAPYQPDTDWSHMNLPPYLTDSIGFTESLTPPRYIKNHMPWELLPKQIRNGEAKPKIIYVARNPKDTCVSYYHHYRVVASFKGSLEDFCEMFLDNKVLYCPFWAHVAAFWKRKDDPNILFLTYEEMKQDLKEVIRKVAEFLDKKLNEIEVNRLEQHLSFENMKKNSAVNNTYLMDNFLRENPDVIPDDDLHFIRKGKVGTFKETMSKDFIQKFDRWTDENVKKYGLPTNLFTV